MREAFLGVDVGTTSTTCVALGRDGSLLCQASLGHAVDSPQPGFFEHDVTSVWWLGVAATLRSVVAALPSDVTVTVLGLSSCGPCLVPVDEAGRPLRAGILYGVDTRATQQIRQLDQLIGQQEVVAAYGMPLTSQSAGPKIDWLVEHEPEIYAHAQRLLPANGFAAYQLTGRMCIDHHQAAYFAPYYRDGAWDRAYDRAGVVDKLPELVWSTDVVGQVTDDAADITGLPGGLPVVIGSSDGLTAAFGAGDQGNGRAVLNYGGTLGLTVVTTLPTNAGGVWRTPGSAVGEVCLVAGLSTGGVLLTWFIERFAQEFGDVAAAYTALAREAAASPPGANGLLLLPHFAGASTPFYDPGAAGAILGLRLDHSRGDVYRALLEGTAFGVRQLIAEPGWTGVEVETIRAVGGGTRTPLWQQIVSDVTGIPQHVMAADYGAPVGAAMLAALSTGVVLGPIADAFPVERTVSPAAADAAHYDDVYAVYTEAYARTRPLISDLAPRAAPQ